MSHLALNIAKEFQSESRSVEASSQRSRLLRFRTLLQSLEYEYSILLQHAPAESPLEREESWDDMIPGEKSSFLVDNSPVGDNKPLISGRSERASPHTVFADTSCFSRDVLDDEELLDLSSLTPQDDTMYPHDDSKQYQKSLVGRNARNSFQRNYGSVLVGGRTSEEDFKEMFSARSLNSLPVWWNPGKEILREMMGRGASLDSFQDPGAYANSRKACFVLSPMDFPKLQWDFIGFVLIFYDSWAAPFYMIFSSESLELSWMRHIDHAITCFFALDIVLNFNTGVFMKRGICFERDTIVKLYLQSWFWIDLAATIPYELIYEDAGFAGLLRMIKFARFLKTLRLSRIFRLMKTIRSLHDTDNRCFQIMNKSSWLMHLLGVLSVLILNVHFFSCAWLALNDFVHEVTFAEAADVYFNAYVAIFFALTNGTRLNAQSTGKKLFEMVIATEKLLLICLFGAYVIFEALVRYGDRARSKHLRDQVQTYMMRHGLPIGTQIEVLSGLEEARSVKGLQKDFITITSSDLPEELRQKIARELWEGNLMKLDLIARISEWDADFVRSLALVCREEVFATDVLLFREHDLSIAAYFIVSGELKVSCALIDEAIPNFKEGSWVGENALVNPSFRRGLRVVSLCLSSVMVVSSARFQTMLKDANLWHHFEELIIQELSHGLCGRCGSIGDHFFDHCPYHYGQRMFSFATDKKSTCFCCPLRARPDTVVAQEANVRALVDFLYHFDSLHLLPYLQEVNVCSLAQLQSMDIDSLTTHLEKLDPPGELSAKDRRVLSESSIMLYRDIQTQGMGERCNIENDQHLMFLSHYKVEAGTEAALMRSELEEIIDKSSIGEAAFEVPIFLDSEDLKTLRELEDHVKKSFNVVLLLTRGVLSRPWVLVELVTAMRSDIPVVLLQVVKPSAEFTFPDESFYVGLLDGKFLDEGGKQLLNSCNIELNEVVQTLRKVFQNIAVVYSPHRPAHIRHAELKALLGCCKIRSHGLKSAMIPGRTVAKSKGRAIRSRGPLDSHSTGENPLG